MDIENYDVPDNTKVETVRPILKKKSRNELENYRPISLLSVFSKFYERCIPNLITTFIKHFLSIFISDYRKSYSSNHMLIRLIENWKQSLDNRKFVGAALIDLSKAFYVFPTIFEWQRCMLTVLALIHLKYFFSYLKGRKENVNINDTYSVFQVLLSGFTRINFRSRSF